MKKHDLLKDGNNIIRVLEIKPDKIFIIDCIKKTMPVCMDALALDSFSSCNDKILNEITEFSITGINMLDAEQRKSMYDRYTLIAPILPFIADEKMRSKIICSIATEHHVSKQTLRNYLCLYLTYMDIAVLASKKQLNDDVNLTQDEKTYDGL